jgi:hypothetical protein
MLYGGYGQSAYGRLQYGSPAPHSVPVVEPRFSFSNPRDGARNQPVNRWARFEVYYYTTSPPKVVDHPHWGTVPSVLIEVSLDGGDSFVPIFDASVEDPSTPPYSDYEVRVRRVSGQRVWVIVRRVGGWPIQSKVRFRYTGPDEFGQPATKEVPVKWRSYVV